MRNLPPLDEPKSSAVQALIGLALAFAGAACVSVPAALLLCGLLVWHDATRHAPSVKDTQK